MLKDALGLILTGENDVRLKELCSSRPVAALPIWGRYRVMDFLLSNMVNSGIRNVGVIAQKNYHSLMDHVGTGREWDLNRKRDGLFILPPFVTKENTGVYKGTIDALLSVTGYLKRSTQKYVIFSNSHTVFKADFTDAMKAHIKTGADITVLYTHANPDIPVATGSYITLDDDSRITSIAYNPSTYVSDTLMMDVWIMEKSLLLNLVEEAAAKGLYTFVRGMLMHKLDSLNIFGYNHPGFVGFIDSVNSYYLNNLMLLKEPIRNQIFPMDGSQPIYTKIKDEIPAFYTEDSRVSGCMIADGCIIEGQVENSILFRDVRVGRGAVIKNSVIMQGTEVSPGAQLEHVILDKGCFIKRDVRLIGQMNYPIVIAKSEVV